MSKMRVTLTLSIFVAVTGALAAQTQAPALFTSSTVVDSYAQIIASRGRAPEGRDYND